MTSPPQLTLTLPPPSLQLPPSFSPRTSVLHSPSLEMLANRMCDPLVIYHACGHISEFSCSVGRSFQPGEVHEFCTFNVPPLSELEGVCGVCFERGTVTSNSFTSLTSFTSSNSLTEGEREKKGIKDVKAKVRLKFRGLRLKIRGCIFRVARGECELSDDQQPQTLKEEYRESIVAFGEEVEEIWVKARETRKRIRGWVFRTLREDSSRGGDREIVGCTGYKLGYR